MLLSVAAPALAQSRFQTTGPNECLNCHDHQAERTWYEKNEIPEVRKLFPEKGTNAGHINALKQLEAAKSNDYAKAIGLKDKYDTKGSCVKCHGTVFSGDANAGVSCESCHGAASGYLKPHQTKGSYDQQVAQFGMTKLVGNLAGWAQQCTTCHVMDDAKLVAAGHPSGDDFDLGKKYGPVALHFKKKYSVAEVSAIGRTQVDALVRKRGGGAAPPAAAATPPATAPAAAVAAAADCRARDGAGDGARGRAQCAARGPRRCASASCGDAERGGSRSAAGASAERARDWCPCDQRGERSERGPRRAARAIGRSGRARACQQRQAGSPRCPRAWPSYKAA